jgi:hypothetical protein
MPMNRLVLCSCLLLAATTSLVDIGWARTPSPSNTGAKQEAEGASHISVKLPVRLYGGYLVIAEGAIGNIRKLNFLVDTGAWPSVVDQKIALDLKLAEQPERVNLWNKSVQAGQVVIPSLSLGPVRVDSIPVLSEDLSFLQKALGFKVHAIVGLDVLRKSSFTINYKTKEILFGIPEALTHSVPFETDTPVVTVRMGFHDRRLRMVVDSGGPDLTLFRSRVSEPSGLQALGTETVVDAGGTFQRTRVRIPDLYIGNETFGSQTAFVVNDRKDEGDDFDGVLGVRGLQFWKVAFDFENRRLSWEMLDVDPTVTVGIYDDVQLPQKVLAEARYEATRVYQKAGVAISLIECKSSKVAIEVDLRCQDSVSAKRINLRIVPHARKSSDSVFGIAFLSAEGTGAYGDVFYDSAEKLDRDWHVGLARVLGHVMAHELGHLLLGSNAHSRLGIMCPTWHGDELHLASRGALLFSEDQARLMRERLAR